MVLAKTHQLDFNIDFGLNSSSVDRYFGIGYSFRPSNEASLRSQSGPRISKAHSESTHIRTLDTRGLVMIRLTHHQGECRRHPD
jgi:hypothetical protein